MCLSLVEMVRKKKETNKPTQAKCISRSVSIVTVPHGMNWLGLRPFFVRETKPTTTRAQEVDRLDRSIEIRAAPQGRSGAFPLNRNWEDAL